MGALIAAIDASQYAHDKFSKVETEISNVLHNNAREIAQDLQFRARGTQGTQSQLADPLPPIPPVDWAVQKKAEDEAKALLRAGKTVPPEIGQYVRRVGHMREQIPLTNFLQLKHCPYLTHAFLGGSSATNFTVLSGHPYLKWLELKGTELSDLVFLSRLKKLRSLDVALTSVSDVTPLRGLTQLQELSLSNTSVSDITPLRGLTQLKALWLNNTPVTDWSPVDHVDHVLGRPEDWPR